MTDADPLLQRLQTDQARAPAYLASRITANLPQRDPLDEVFGWVQGRLWRGAALVVLPLAVGFFAAQSFEQPNAYSPDSLLYVDGIEELRLVEI